MVPDPADSYLGSHLCSTDLTVSICIANNYHHAVWNYTPMRSDLVADLTFVVNETWDNDTQLDAYMTTNFDIADARVYYANYGPSPYYYGATYCPTYATKSGTDPNVVCKPQIVRFNSYFPGAFDSQGERRGLACHEIGHTVGLWHNGNPYSCMNNTYAPPIYDHPDALDIQDVNAKYNPY